jgi:hypothetical protein
MNLPTTQQGLALLSLAAEQLPNIRQEFFEDDPMQDFFAMLAYAMALLGVLPDGKEEDHTPDQERPQADRGVL